MPFPNPDTQFKPGQSGFAGRKHVKPDVEALNKLIAEMEAEPGIAKTWLREALGDVKKGIPPNVALFKMLIEYRNGKVPQPIAIQDQSTTSEDTRSIREIFDKANTEPGPESGTPSSDQPDGG